MQETLHLLTLLGAVQGVFFSLVLFQLRRGNRLANRFLALFLLVISITMIGIVDYASKWVLHHPHFALLHTPFGAIFGSPFLMYIIVLTSKNFRMKWWHWCLFIPFLIVLVWLLPFYGSSAAEKMTVLQNSYSSFPASWRNIFIFSNLFNFGMIVYANLLILRHERVIREVYSSPVNKSLLWARNFLFIGTGIFFLCVFMSLSDIVWADSFSNFEFALLIYIFGYRAMRQPDIFSDVSEATLPESTPSLVHSKLKYEKSGLPLEKSGELLARLDQLMDTEKLFLDPELNLQQLATRMEMPPHQLSQLLNQFKGESFSDYVNAFRVEYFKTAVHDPANAHLSILGVAYECGFNSKAAFNAVFKKMTGTTPSAFVAERGFAQT